MEQDGNIKKHHPLSKIIKEVFDNKKKNRAESEQNQGLQETNHEHAELLQKTHDLEERTKELRLFFKIFDLANQENISEKEFLQIITEQIPDAWQFPEITGARIQFRNKGYETSNFKLTQWKLTSEITINREKAGSVEVVYLKEMPPSDEGPFMQEERNLLDSLAIKIGHYFERKYIRKKLEESVENLRTTLDSIADGVITTDTVGRITNLNPVAEMLTGWTNEEARNKTVDEVFVIENSQTGERVQNPVAFVLKTGQVAGLANHTKLISRQGNEYQIADSGAPVKNKAGEITGVVLVFRDVTKEYQIQQEIKENENRFRTIVEGAPDPIYIQSEMKFSYLNPAACRLFGVESADDLVGTPIMERFHPDYYEKIRERIKTINQKLQSVREPFEQKFIRMDGSEVWVETTGEPIVYNGRNSALVFVRDISLRMQAAQELKESEERWHFALEGAGDGVWDWNVKTGKLFFSDQWKKMLGYEPNEIENDFKEWESRVHPDDLKNANSAIEKYLRGEISSYISEHRLRCKDGSYKWILDRGKVVSRDEKGQPLRFIGTHTDINDRKLAQKALRESETRFRLLAESAPFGIVIADQNQKTLFANQRFTKIFGYTLNDIPSVEHWWPLAYPDEIERNEIRENWNRAVEKAQKEQSVIAPLEYLVRCKNGEYKHIEFRSAAFKKLNFVLFTDITKRKRAEHAITESERRLATLMGNLPGMAYRCKNDELWTMEFVSSGCLALTGYPPESLVNNAEITYSNLIFAEDRERIWNEVQEAIQNNRPFVMEYRIVTKNGNLIWAWEQGRAVSSTANKNTHIEGFVMEITGRKQAETELKNLKNDLEFQVKEKTKELQERLTELERFQEATIEREFRIKELRNELQLLKKERHEQDHTKQ